MDFKLNVNKSADDERDYQFEKLMKSNVNVTHCSYENDLLPVRNQGTQGTCYAQVAACVKEWQENKNEYFSPQFFYNHRNYFNNNKQDGDDINEDYGMTGRDVMRILKNVGICEESMYPYGLLEKESEINNDIKNAAKQNVIKSYARINTLEGLKQSLLQNGPCLIAFPVYNYSDQFWIQNEGESFKGGHAVIITESIWFNRELPAMLQK